MEEDNRGVKGEEDPETSSQTPEAQTASISSADEGGGRSWWMTEVPGSDSDRGSSVGSASSSSRWDFSGIPFPDLGTRERGPGCMAPPDPALLPGDLSVGVCDVACWLQRINLRKVKMSAREQRREGDKRRRRWDVNKDREVGTT